jgi:hypothetical protein
MGEYFAHYIIDSMGGIVANESEYFININQLNKANIEKAVERIIVSGKFIKTNYYGNLEDCFQYIGNIHSYFGNLENGNIFLKFFFNLTKKDKSNYACQIILKI